MLRCRTSAMLMRSLSSSPRDVERVAAVVGDHRVDDQDVRAQVDELVRRGCCRRSPCRRSPSRGGPGRSRDSPRRRRRWRPAGITRRLYQSVFSRESARRPSAPPTGAPGRGRSWRCGPGERTATGRTRARSGAPTPRGTARPARCASFTSSTQIDPLFCVRRTRSRIERRTSRKSQSTSVIGSQNDHRVTNRCRLPAKTR